VKIQSVKMPEHYWEQMVKSVSPREHQEKAMRATFYWGLASSVMFISELQRLPDESQRVEVYVRWAAEVERGMEQMMKEWDGNPESKETRE
jgi:hypothetical protein